MEIFPLKRKFISLYQKFPFVYSKFFGQLASVIILLEPFPEYRKGLCFFR